MNTPSTSRTVLVTGATGQQGGAVARALLQHGHAVRGLTRNTDSDAARALAGLGAELVQGDFTDRDSLLAAARGVDTIFLMTTPFEAGVDAEAQQGLLMADVAREAGVGHVVFSSVASADKQTGIPHFDSKYQVEEAIAASGIPYTIVAPVFFMDNVLAPWLMDSIQQGKLAMAMPGDVNLQQVSTNTIGEFVRAVIERRETVFSKRFDLAEDELTGEESVGSIARDAGTTLHYEGFPAAYLSEHNEDFAIMFEWFVSTGYSTDIPALKAAFPEVSWTTYAAWSAGVDWAAAGIEANAVSEA